jgi:polypeptide N-acetylgalactosaminyltransferase
LSKVRLLRTSKREGLIRARLKGAAASTAEALIFLDSHCEATEGWLEPLLDPIARNKNTSTVPVIEIIDEKTFGIDIAPYDDIQIGGFTWDMAFIWLYPSQSDLDRREKRTDPIRSPTMAGGLFAIDRSYFEMLGGYDPGMDIWGGENLELSFKVGLVRIRSLSLSANFVCMLEEDV